MPVLFCNIGWMSRYDGIDGDSIQRGGAYNKEAIGHEVCNFSNVDSKVYGYVRLDGCIKIMRLGAGKNDESIEGVTVIWVASPDSGGTAIVGWYKNATVFRDPQKIKKGSCLQKKNGLNGYRYRILADASNATLLPIEKRGFMVPRAVKGGIGQSNVWYADGPESADLVERALKLVNSGRLSDQLPDVDASNRAWKEGNPRLASHLIRERNNSIVREKKKEVLAKTGALRCEICDFDFKKVYGKYGSEFCEVHHRLPLHQADGVVKTELSDLAIVCSNCHRIIHRTDPMPSIQDLSKIVSDNA